MKGLFEQIDELLTKEDRKIISDRLKKKLKEERDSYERENN